MLERQAIVVANFVLNQSQKVIIDLGTIELENSRWPGTYSPKL